MVRLKPPGIILQHPLILWSVVDSLQFCIIPVVVGIVVDLVTHFKYEGLDFFLCICVRARPSKGTLCSLKKSILLLTG